MRLTEHLAHLLRDLLERHRVVVWYDGARACGDFVAALHLPNTTIVAGASALEMRRAAETTYRTINRAATLAEAQRNLLIYLPQPRRAQSEARVHDPFEVFAAVGCAFGDKAAEQLPSLATQAMPELASQIARMVREGTPTFAVLDRLEQGAQYPLVAQALGTTAVTEIAVLLVSDAGATARIDAVAGAHSELLRLLQAELGFAPALPGGEWPAVQQALVQTLLLSELAFDLPAPLPAGLANLPRTADEARPQVFAICERLRDGVRTRDRYIDFATAIEQRLGLPGHFQGVAQLGVRDTFPFEEKQYLAATLAAIDGADLVGARRIVAGRSASIWRELPERSQRWRLAERCLDLLEVAADVEATWQNAGATPCALVEGYAAEAGWWRLDRAQRHMEQSAAQCGDCDQLDELLAACRRRYRAVMTPIQDRFLQLVAQHGWAPEGVTRQDALFDRLLAPALAGRARVALFLVDSLRYEMGCDLAGVLKALGSVTLQPAAATLPTITRVGMAALLPGAAGALSLRAVNGGLVTHLGETPLPTLEARRQFLQQKYGDRYADIEMGEFLSLNKEQRASRVRNRDLLVLRDLRIDNLGETATLHEVRKHLHDLLADIHAAIMQVTRLGYRHVVVVTDHGHLLFPDAPPEALIAPPEGQWLLAKRRVLLGAPAQGKKGVLTFDAPSLGIQGDATMLASPRGFGLFSGGSGYVHGGLSLQECVIPALVLHATAPAEPAGWGSQVQISYAKSSFSGRAIYLKVSLITMAPDAELRVRVEAYAGPEPKAAKVGEAAECDARDEVTHEVVLRAGGPAGVPLLLDQDFAGDAIEVRAIDREGVVLHRLTLKNGMLD